MMINLLLIAIMGIMGFQAVLVVGMIVGRRVVTVTVLYIIFMVVQIGLMGWLITLLHAKGVTG